VREGSCRSSEDLLSEPSPGEKTPPPTCALRVGGATTGAGATSPRTFSTDVPPWGADMIDRPLIQDGRVRRPLNWIKLGRAQLNEPIRGYGGGNGYARIGRLGPVPVTPVFGRRRRLKRVSIFPCSAAYLPLWRTRRAPPVRLGITPLCDRTTGGGRGVC